MSLPTGYSTACWRFGMYAEVIVDVHHQSLDRVFTYRVPDELDVRRGHRVSVPFHGRSIEGFVLDLCETTALKESIVKDIHRVLDEEPALLAHMIDLALHIRDTSHSLLVDALRLLIPAQMRGGRVREKTVRIAVCALSASGLEAALGTLKRAPKQKQALELLFANGELPATVLGPTLPPLVARGYATIREDRVRRVPHRGISPRSALPFQPSRDQARVLERLLRAYQERKGSFLLHGVTGSGKTEVYLQLIQRALDDGRQAILLVPEIALTPQMVDWFRARFPEDVAVLHSRLSVGERFDEWRRIREGGARLVVGARSAVFAPFDNLGVIVVDEEHETSYLSDHSPRYDAREVAQNRAEREGAVLVLGSATPSVTTYLRAQKGELELIELPERVMARPMPEVCVVDMRRELVGGNRSVISQTLLSELRATAVAGRQSMLLLNRRGYHPFITCRSCGKTVKCPHCDVSLTYHQDGMARCHYCEYSIPPPKSCPACESTWIKMFGAGTQKIEEELRELLPGVSMLRMDNDTTRGKDGHEKILSEFREGRAQVLIGTQMIAKGHDFPRVTLVGILAADLTLHVPDYRSEERCFQLITQMAGRAGRGFDPGRVIVQTYDPDHYAVANAARQDYHAFYTEEIRRRRVSLYPPFAEVARLLCSSQSADAARDTALSLEEEMRGVFRINPVYARALVQMRAMEAPIGRLRDEARWMLFLKLYPGDAGAAVVEELARMSRKDGFAARVQLEVNPQSMM